MKANIRLLLRFYPAVWRKRYGSEFGALLEDVGLNWRTVFDLLTGATKMHFTIPSLPKTIGLFAGAGVLLGFSASWLLTPRYVSTAALRYTGGTDRVEQLVQTRSEVLSRTSLSAIMLDPRLNLYLPQREKAPLEEVIGTMRKDIRIAIAQPGQGNAFSLSFSYSDPRKAQATVQSLVSRFMDTQALHNVEDVTAGSAIDRLQQRVAEIERRLNVPPSDTAGNIKESRALKVLDPPSLPINPIYPNRAACATVGFGCGIMLALVLYALRRPANPIMPLRA